MIPEGEQKRGFLRMLREKLPELPAWLKYENQVQAARASARSSAWRGGVRLNPLFFASPVLRQIFSPRALLAAHTRDADCPPSLTISPASATCSRFATPSQARREDATRILKSLERFPVQVNFQFYTPLLCIA